MTEPTSPQPLDYRDPRQDRTRIWSGVCITLGVILGWGTLFALQVFWILYNYGMNDWNQKNAFAWKVPSLVTLGVIGIVALIELPVHRRMQSRLFLKAICVGALLCLLMDGVCYLQSR